MHLLRLLIQEFVYHWPRSSNCHVPALFSTARPARSLAISHAPTKVVIFTLTTSRPRRLELGTPGTSRLSATVGEADLLSVTWLSCSLRLRPRSYQPQSTSTNTLGALPPSSQPLFCHTATKSVAGVSEISAQSSRYYF